MPPLNPPVSPQTVQAESRMDASTFDFDKFNQSLAEQQQIRQAREAEEIRTAKTQGDIRQQSALLAQDQQQSLRFLLDDVNAARAKAQDARRLADSNNPLDTLELFGKQMSDPNGYLRKQREARLTEDMQQAGVLQTYFAAGQDALNKKLVSSTANLDLLKTIESVGNEKLTAYSDAAKLMHGQMLAVQSMKDDAITNLTDQQLSAALQQAKQNPNGTVNIGGVDVDSRTLEDRQGALAERSFNNLSRQVAMTLKQDDANHIGDTLADRETQRAIAKNDRDHLDQSLAMRNMERNQQAENLITAANRRDLATRNKTELNSIRNNNYKDPVSGIQYQPDDVESAYENRQQAENNQAAEQVQQFQLDNFDTGVLSQEATRVDGIMNRFKTSMPLYQAATKYQAAIHTAALGSGSDKGQVTRIAAMKIYQDSRAQFDKAIEAQAKLDASNGGRGQLDSNLESMRIAYYRGEPIPQENLVNAAVDRLTKYRSLADIFPPDVASAIEKHYRDSLQAGNSFLTPTQSPEDKKIAQANAAQEAIQWGVNQKLNGLTETVTANQVADPTHPLHNLSPAQFGAYVKAADDQGAAMTGRQAGLDQTQTATLAAGQPLVGKSTAEMQTLMTQLRFNQNYSLLQILDGVKPGLGSQVSNWWQEHGNDYVERITPSLVGDKGSTFQGSNFASTAGDLTQQGYSAYAMGLAQADQNYQQGLIQRNADLVTFSSNPESAQVAILSNDKNLTDPERTQIFQEVIRPLLKTAADRGMDFATTNQFVEQNLQSYQAQTPEMKSLMKTVRRDRTNVLESMNTWSRSIRDLFTVTSPNVAASVDKGDLIAPETRWYKDWRVKNKVDSVQVPYKPSISLGPLQIGGDPVAYEQAQRARMNR